MKVKELLKQVGFKAIFEYISSFTSALYSENFIAATETFEALTNEDNLPVNHDIAARYTLDLSAALCKKLPEIITTPEDVIASLFYSLYTANGRSYQISERYVKNIVDFSECEVKPGTCNPAEECAALMVLSFSVLHDKLKSIYGDISAMKYIYILKSIPSFSEGEDEE